MLRRVGARSHFTCLPVREEEIMQRHFNGITLMHTQKDTNDFASRPANSERDFM